MCQLSPWQVPLPATWQKLLIFMTSHTTTPTSQNLRVTWSIQQRLAETTHALKPLLVQMEHFSLKCFSKRHEKKETNVSKAFSGLVVMIGVLDREPLKGGLYSKGIRKDIFVIHEWQQQSWFKGLRRTTDLYWWFKWIIKLMLTKTFTRKPRSSFFPFILIQLLLFKTDISYSIWEQDMVSLNYVTGPQITTPHQGGWDISLDWTAVCSIWK